jgi:hypothetical protein
MKKQTKQQAIQHLYERLRAASEIPITERDEISSKGLYMTLHGRPEIYIKQPMAVKEKLKVLLHEYAHYVHTTHYYTHESRPMCELIANGAAFVVCREYGLDICKPVDIAKFTKDAAVVERLTVTIQAVAGHILAGLNQKKGDD